MKTYPHKFYLLLLFYLVIVATSCRKKAPDGFNADFKVAFNNGGMAPDTILLTAQFPDADLYQWSIEGVPSYGQQTATRLQTAGNYEIELLVESGKHDRTKTISVPIENYPSGGSALSIVQEGGIIGTIGVDGAAPFFLPIDTIDNENLVGMDYDDNTKQLYYTGSIYRAFPNGAGKEKIFDDNQLSSGDQIVDLVVDADDQRVYFAINGFQSQSIASINQDGSDLNFEFQFTGFFPIQDITLDAVANTVYFTTDFSTSIFKTINGDVATVYADNSQKYALVFDNTTKYLYYAEQAFDNSGATKTNILRFNPEIYNASEPATWPTIVVDNASADTIKRIDISENKQQLYWSDAKEKIIYRIDLNNLQAEREIVFRNVSNPKALAIGNFD